MWPPAAAAPRETAAITPPYPPATTVQPCAARRPPSRPAASCRGSPAATRADPSTATSTGPAGAPGIPGEPGVSGEPGGPGRSAKPESAGDELVLRPRQVKMAATTGQRGSRYRRVLVRPWAALSGTGWVRGGRPWLLRLGPSVTQASPTLIFQSFTASTLFVTVWIKRASAALRAPAKAGLRSGSDSEATWPKDRACGPSYNVSVRTGSAASDGNS